jgi:rubrerythrin
MSIDLARLDLRDALDLAILMEEEARVRYQDFSKLVGGRYTGDASDIFTLMASYEARHGAQLVERRRALFADQPSRVKLEMLDDLEAPDQGQPRSFMSARDAVVVALRSEQKAWAFFDEAIKSVKDPDVKKLFGELRTEELEHQALLKNRLAKLPPGPDVTEEEADQPGSDGG